MLFQKCDVVLKDYQLTSERNKLLELVPWSFGNIEFIFQLSDSRANIDAIAKPYQLTVGYYV